MTDQAAYERARTRAKNKLDFYGHVLAYVVVNAFLFGLNWFTSPDYYWALWPLLGWAVGLLLHGASVFFGPGNLALLDKMTERELEKERQWR